MQFKPLTEMDTGELAAELEMLIDVLPSMRHMPTITLDKALDLAARTCDSGTEEERTRLEQLIGYSADHAARFAAVVQRISDLRAYLIPDEDPAEWDTYREAHALLSAQQLQALLEAQRAFRSACDIFVAGTSKPSTMLSRFHAHLLSRLDAVSVSAGKQLEQRFKEFEQQPAGSEPPPA
jgi:hypothetical protein